MLNNFLTYSDILRKKADLSNLMDDSEITSRLEDSFVEFETKLRQDKGVLPEMVMIPEWLAENTIVTSNYSGNSITKNPWNVVKRIVIEKSSCTLAGTNVLRLYGSHDNINFKNIKEIVLTAGKNTQTAIFIGNYRYYKFDILTSDIIIPASGEGENLIPESTITGTLNMACDIYLVENSFDKALILLTLANLYGALVQYDNDVFASESDKYLKAFEIEFANLSFSRDSDGDLSADIEDGSFSSYERMV